MHARVHVLLNTQCACACACALEYSVCMCCITMCNTAMLFVAGAVEVWLLEVESAMKRTLHKVIFLINSSVCILHKVKIVINSSVCILHKVTGFIELRVIKQAYIRMFTVHQLLTALLRRYTVTFLADTPPIHCGESARKLTIHFSHVAV